MRTLAHFCIKKKKERLHTVDVLKKTRDGVKSTMGKYEWNECEVCTKHRSLVACFGHLPFGRIEVQLAKNYNK